MAILLSDNELEALYGLPMLAFRAYVAAIRPRMDIRTGYVGRIARISYQALIEWCYVEPHQGRTREAVSPDQMYRAVRVLEAAGLVRIASEMATKRLIFQCPLAEVISHAQNKPATNPRLKAATREARQDNGFSEEAATSEEAQAATHRSKEYTCLSVASSSSTEPQYQQAPKGGEACPPHSIAPQGGAEGPQEANAVPLEVPPAFALETLSKASMEGRGLFFPSGLNETQRLAIASKISKLRERRQDVLDELAGFMSRTGKPVQNPIRYVDFIIDKAKLPDWIPEHASAVRAARETAAAVRRPEPSTVSIPSVPSEVVRAMAGDLLNQLKRARA